MNETRLTDRDIQAAFLARAQGAPSAELTRRIATDVRATRQPRPILRLPGFVHPSTVNRLAWAAALAATVLALLGLLVIGGGGRNDLTSFPPTPLSSPLAAAPTVTASPVSPTSQASASAGASGPALVRYVDPETGRSVTLVLEDASGLLLGAVGGEYGLIEPSGTGVDVANLPNDTKSLRVEWPTPAGCASEVALSVTPDARTITVHTPAGGGDSIGGFCGVTLRFSEEVPATEVDGILDAIEPSSSPAAP
jgi:hypothetical protein